MKKLNLLLASIGAAALLGGATFAAWAVTDNADPMGVKVTPGTIDDDGTQYATLSWGESTSLSNVSLIKPAENRKVGVLELLTNGPEYIGLLNLEIMDKTVAEEHGPAYLKDYITVRLYEGDQSLKEVETAPATSEEPAKLSYELPDATPVATLEAQYNKETKSYKVVYDKAKGFKHTIAAHESIPETYVGNFYSVFVTLENSSAPVFAQFEKDMIYLSVDWSPKNGDLSTSKTVYTSKPADWSNLYAFAWTGALNNSPFPGVQMNKVKEDLYSVEVPNTLENILFDQGDNVKQTVDLSLKDFNQEEPYYDMANNRWIEVPEIEGIEYHVVGCIKGDESNWAFDKGIKLEPNEGASETEYCVDIEFFANDRIKVADNKSGWYPDGGTDYLITSPGTYTVYFRPQGNSAWGYYFLDAVKKDTPAPTFPDHILYGKFGVDSTKWENKEMTVNPQKNTEYQAFNVELVAGDTFVIHMEENSWFHFNDVKPGCKSLVETDEEGQNMIIKETGTYNVFCDSIFNDGGHIWIAKVTPPSEGN